MDPDLVAQAFRVYRAAPFISMDKNNYHQPTGWSSDRAAGFRLRRKGWWPFIGVTRVTWTAQGNGTALVFRENLLFDAWVKLTIYGLLIAFVIMTSGGRIEGDVLIGIFFGLAFFLFNRWVGRHDFEVLSRHFANVSGGILLETRSATQAPGSIRPDQPTTVAGRPNPFGRAFAKRKARRSPFED